MRFSNQPQLSHTSSNIGIGILGQICGVDIEPGVAGMMQNELVVVAVVATIGEIITTVMDILKTIGHLVNSEEEVILPRGILEEEVEERDPVKTKAITTKIIFQEQASFWSGTQMITMMLIW